MLEVHGPAHNAMTGDIAAPPRDGGVAGTTHGAIPKVVHAPDDGNANATSTTDDANVDATANDGVGPLDPLSLRLRNEALEAESDEPELSTLLRSTVLAPPVRTFEDAVACTAAYRLLGRPPACDKMIAEHPSAGGERPMFCPNDLQRIIASALSNPDETELGHTMSEAVRLDALAVLDRDPACESLLEVVLFYKGFAALVAHRAARQRWNPANKRSITALWLQSQASSQFGLDIHPAASIGAGVMFDHGTGVVIGETAVVGDGCTLLHGVTLGGTGKERGDRHPKVGAHVLIGAGASILGNITVGSGAKIGAGSIVLRPIPSGATAVGAPAKIVGRAVESDPASTVDETLRGVSPLHVSHHHKNKKQQSSSKPSRSPDATAAADVVKMNRINSSVTSSTATLSLLTEPETDLDDDDATNSDDSSSSRRQQRRDENDCMCPFRELRRLGQREAPSHPGCITFCMLWKLLGPAGANYAQVGEVYFAMDEDLVGYIPLSYFRDHCVECIERYTNLSVGTVESVVGPFLEEQERKVREISS